MTKPLSLLLLLLAVAIPVSAQEREAPEGARIATAHVSGIDTSRLSPDLRDAIGKLVGTSLDRARLRELASRLEAEQPRFVAAIKTTTDAAGAARVDFVVARIRDEAQNADVNARYVVQDARIEGVADARIPDELRRAIEALVGKTLDSEEAERIENKLRNALPNYSVVRRTIRGSQPGRITLIFDVERGASARMLRFEPTDAGAVYHSKQGWGGTFPLTIQGGNLLINPILTFSNADGLVNEYSGFALRIESRKVGTERLGVFFEWSTLKDKWRDSALSLLDADGSIPAAYRHRSSVTPLVKFAVTPHITVGGGVSITDLEPLDGVSASSRSANAGVGLLRFHQRWSGDDKPRHDVDASFTMRSGLRGLSSDFSYNRYFLEAGYQITSGPQRLFVGVLGGRLTGDGPLFERFSLGDTRTLRGWDKFAITPLGGNRMRHTTLEYAYHDVGVFFDAGASWTSGAPVENRFAAGLTITPGPLFFTLGFPLNGDGAKPVFAMGLRMATGHASIQKH